MKRIATLFVGTAVVAALLVQRYPAIARLLFYSALCGLVVLLLGNLVWPCLGSCRRYIRAHFPGLLRQSHVLKHRIMSLFPRKEVVTSTRKEEPVPTASRPTEQNPVSAKMLELELLHWQIGSAYPSALTHGGYLRVAGAIRLLTHLASDVRCPEALVVEYAQRLSDDLHQFRTQLKEPVSQ